MNRTIIFLAFGVFTMLAIIGCRGTKEISGGGAGVMTEDFDRFYDRFHSDSLFQISRIVFPLKGYSNDGGEVTEWTRENWPGMKTRIYDIDTTVYKVSYRKSPTTFKQKVWLENSGFSSESRFELRGRKWFLVFVMDLNL